MGAWVRSETQHTVRYGTVLSKDVRVPPAARPGSLRPGQQAGHDDVVHQRPHRLRGGRITRDQETERQIARQQVPQLVVHGVTFETEELLLAAFRAHGGELTRLSVEHAAPLGGRFHGWQPSRAVTQWAWTKPLTEREHA